LEEAVMDRLAYALYRLVAGVLRVLPLTAGFRLGSTLGSIAWFFAPTYRRLVRANLRIAFGAEKSDPEIEQIARAHFASLGANLLTSIKLPTLTTEEIASHVTVEGLELMDPQVAAGGGFVFVISHIGNWEMFAQLVPRIYKCKTGTIYQRLGNAYLDAEVRRSRARLGMALFERKEGFIAASKFLREGGAVGVLIDQHAGDAGLWCPLFGRLASTSTLAATLALRTGAWLMPAAVYTDGVARWRVILQPPMSSEGKSPETITAEINDVLAGQIRRNPEDWFWVHNRWKTPKPKFLLATYKRGIALGAVNPDSGMVDGIKGEAFPHPPPVTSHDSLAPFRILIRASNWLGDAVMTVPAMRAIKGGRPDAHVTILTQGKLADFWESVPEVDAVIAIAKEESVFAVARKLRDHFDAAILFPNSLRTALEVWLAGIPRRVGYPGHRRAWLLNQIFRPKQKSPVPRPRHQVHHYLALAEFVGAEIPPHAAEIVHRNVPPERVVAADSLFAKGAPTIGLCAGAEYGPAKRWLPERFAEVVTVVRERTGCEWKLFGVEGDLPLTDQIVMTAGGPLTHLVGQTTLAQLISELRTCDLLLTNDTGTMHLAAHLGVPVVALFGSTEPSLTGPLGAGHRVLRHHVECSPCFLRECPRDFRCMQAITTEEVVTAVELLLAEVGKDGKRSVETCAAVDPLLRQAL
jgi:lipopolysaccharide heptosyltransferase II